MVWACRGYLIMVVILTELAFSGRVCIESIPLLSRCELGSGECNVRKMIGDIEFISAAVV